MIYTVGCPQDLLLVINRNILTPKVSLWKDSCLSTRQDTNAKLWPSDLGLTLVQEEHYIWT